MKKILLFLLAAPLFLAGYFIKQRVEGNLSMIIPYPYVFESNTYDTFEVDAPVLIIGDRMGTRLSKFSELLSNELSKGLTNKLKVHSISSNGEGVHRTLEKIKKLKKMPLFVIYFGGSEETYEEKFFKEEMKTILNNLKLYSNDQIQTALMLYPNFSRLIYNKFKRKNLNKNISLNTSEYSENELASKNEIEFKLYEYHLQELFNYIRERNAALIAISQPINLDIAPKKNCVGTIDDKGIQKLEKLLLLIKEKDFKGAYNLSSKLKDSYSSNARILYLNGQIAKKIGKISEAKKSLNLASAFDCKIWRSSPVFNAILKKVSMENEAFYYDFNKYLQDNWLKNITFEDEIYPQNYYIEKMVEILAIKIRKVLKI